MLLDEAGIQQGDSKLIKLQVATHQASFGHEPRLRLDPQPGAVNQTNRQLVEVIGRAFAAREQLVALTDEELASVPVTQLRHLQRIARLSYLDPALVRSVLNGTQPGRLSARTLWRQDRLPALWAEQRALLLAEGG